MTEVSVTLCCSRLACPEVWVYCTLERLGTALPPNPRVILRLAKTVGHLPAMYHTDNFCERQDGKASNCDGKSCLAFGIK
jgi:hypothetical protein